MPNSAKPSLVLVDDDPHILSAITRCLDTLNITIEAFTSPNEALSFLQDNDTNLILSDQRMPEMDGDAFLNRARALKPDIQRILMSGHHDFDAVADAFNHNIISRYISKPWDDNELLFIVEKAIDNKSHVPQTKSKSKDSQRLATAHLTSADENTEQTTHNQTNNEGVDFHGMVSGNEKVYEVFQRIEKAATANVPIFITGETGTGKELTAQACHKESYRAKHSFIAVNCANFTEHLMESQLFGHKKGAFTGAVSDQAGLFDNAGEGTLFLDEITTLPLTLQAKLLRVIQEREFSPLGSHKLKSFKAQLVTASSTSLQDAVAQGEFREDLLYRLNVIVIALPPLRERGSDIFTIGRHFLQKFTTELEKHFTDFDQGATQLLGEYAWPGNIRQLENVIHGLVAMNEGNQVTLAMLQSALHLPDSTDTQKAASTQSSDTTTSTSSIPQQAEIITPQLIKPLWIAEKETIEHAITACDGNIPKAAALLEISASTVYRKMQAWEKKDSLSKNK